MISKSHHMHQGTLTTESSIMDPFTLLQDVDHQRVLKSIVLSNEMFKLLVAEFLVGETSVPQFTCNLTRSFEHTIDVVTKFSTIDKARTNEKYLGVMLGIDVYYETAEVPPLLALEGLSYVVHYVDITG